MKKVIVYLIFIVSLLCMDYNSVYADSEYELLEDNRSIDFTIEELAGRRLYVYNLVDSFEKESIELKSNDTLSRLEMAKLLYSFLRNDNSLIEDLKNSKSFTDVPSEYRNYVNFLYSNNLISGISETKFGLFDSNLEHFCCILLKYMKIDYDKINVIEKSKELGLLNYYNFDSKSFTRGDAYLILSNLLDIGRNEMVYKDILVSSKDYRDEIERPYKINIYVNSFEDFKKKFDYAYTFTPYKIFINFTDSCTEQERIEVYDYLIKDEYSWKGILNDFYSYSYLNGQFIIKYANMKDSSWKTAKDELSLECQRLYNEINEKIKKGQIDEIYGNYLTDLMVYEKLGVKDKLEIKMCNYHNWVYLNLELIDWIKCFEEDSFSFKIQKCIDDISKYKELSEYDKILNVHNYICKNASYDYKELSRMRNPNSLDNFNLEDAHETIGFVRDGKIVCDGYAYTYQWLLDYLGVDSIIVFGDSTLNSNIESHAWNKVKLEDKWYNVDVCWADTGEGMSYFLKSDEYYDKHFHKIDAYYKDIETILANENYSKS